MLRDYNGQVLSSFWATFNTMGVAYFAIRISIVPIPKSVSLALGKKFFCCRLQIFFSHMCGRCCYII